MTYFSMFQVLKRFLTKLLKYLKYLFFSKFENLSDKIFNLMYLLEILYKKIHFIIF